MNKSLILVFVYLAGCGISSHRDIHPNDAGQSAIAAAIKRVMKTPVTTYVSLGDSIAIGKGLGGASTTYVDEVRTPHLNLARLGWTTQDAIKGELPEVPPKVGLVTVFIGLNDVMFCRNSSLYEGSKKADIFEASLRKLIQGVQATGPRQVILLNLYDPTDSKGWNRWGWPNELKIWGMFRNKIALVAAETKVDLVDLSPVFHGHPEYFNDFKP